MVISSFRSLVFNYIMLLTIIAFILILGFLVLVHELGHFLVARKLGVAVEEFGLGFPPKIISKKIGPTVYSLNALPLGGFVKIKGEDSATSSDPDSFASRPVWQRIVIVAAGVSMNIVAGWLILIVLFTVGAPMEITPDIDRQYVRQSDIVVSEVLPNSPASRAYLKAGDKLIAINGQLVDTVEAFQTAVSVLAGKETNINYERDGVPASAKITPEILKDVASGRPVIGIALSEVGLVRYPFGQAVIKGTAGAGGYLQRIVTAFAGIIKNLAQGDNVGDKVGGPVAIAVATGDMVALGWRYALLFTAILSFNLAIINILPFPALDGGRIVFFIIEKLRGKPSRQEVEAWFHRIGFALLMLLAVFITYRDIVRFGGRIWSAIIR